MSSSAPDDDALRRQFYGARDIRSLYPRVTENHLRYLEKWGLIRPAAHTTTERFYSFTDLSTIKLIDYDFKKYGSSDERKRLLSKWDTEVSTLPQ